MTTGPLDPTPTSVSTRKWGAVAVEDVQKLLVQVGAEKLPPELLAMAREAGAKDGGWPGWLTLGIGMRLAEMCLKGQLPRREVHKIDGTDSDILGQHLFAAIGAATTDEAFAKIQAWRERDLSAGPEPTKPKRAPR